MHAFDATRVKLVIESNQNTVTRRRAALLLLVPNLHLTRFPTICVVVRTRLRQHQPAVNELNRRILAPQVGEKKLCHI